MSAFYRPDAAPNSEISVFRSGAGYTPWVRAAGLEVGRQGVRICYPPRRRIAIPLSMDLGAGGPLRFQGRLQLGLRIRAAGPFYVGVYPFSLLLDVPREEERQASAQLSFRSGIEISVAF